MKSLRFRAVTYVVMLLFALNLQVHVIELRSTPRP
jgi:hypothetical protein